MNSRNTIGGQYRASAARPPASIVRRRQAEDERQSLERKKTRRGSGKPHGDCQRQHAEAEKRPRSDLSRAEVPPACRAGKARRAGTSNPWEYSGCVGPGVVEFAERRPVDPAEDDEEEDGPG